MGIISNDSLRTIYQHACAAYPDECCGFVLADGQVYTGTNIQNELHAKHPDIYPRCSANGYTFSAEDTVRLNESFRTPNPVVIIYHSHPDVGAYFSQEDSEKALFSGEPRYPVHYLVVDVRDAIAKGAKLFDWNGRVYFCCEEYSG